MAISHHIGKHRSKQYCGRFCWIAALSTALKTSEIKQRVVNGSAICFCVAHKLRIDFTFLNGWKKIKRIICDI